MTLVPTDTSRVILEHEVTAARPWADRHGWSLELPADGLALSVRMMHPVDGGPLLLQGDFLGYRAQPPAWVFLDPETEQMTAHAWPKQSSIFGQSLIFHSVGVICVHFSRNAYTVFGGPHDWSLAGWVDVREGVHAENVVEMLAVFRTHLGFSTGRMG